MKRFIDICVSLTGILAAAPFLLLFMYLVYRQDKKSPFYIAPRIGKGGKLFKMIKLRSMSVNADKTGVDSTSVDDARITPVGKMIRKYKLDVFLPKFNLFDFFYFLPIFFDLLYILYRRNLYNTYSFSP